MLLWPMLHVLDYWLLPAMLDWALVLRLITAACALMLLAGLPIARGRALFVSAGLTGALALGGVASLIVLAGRP